MNLTNEETYKDETEETPGDRKYKLEVKNKTAQWLKTKSNKNKKKERVWEKSIN